jgi:YVTN family beta-propeller protein
MRIVRSLGAVAVLAALWLVIGVPSASAAAVVNTTPVGTSPIAVSSDGTHVWVGNYGNYGDYGDHTVSEIDASTGTVVNTIPVATGGLPGPNGVSSDGTHVWVTNTDYGGGYDSVSEIDASTGTVVNTIALPVDNNFQPAPVAVSSDGTHVWVAEWSYGGDSTQGAVFEIDASTGTVVNTIPVGNDDSGNRPDAVSSDGAHVWVPNYADGTVSEVDASTGTVVNTIPVGSAPEGVSSDGGHVWVANSGGGTVSEIDASTGAVVNTIPVGSGPEGVTSDGTHVWVTNAGGIVSEIQIGAASTLLPPPVLGKSVDVAPVSGVVLLKQSGKKAFTRLRAGERVPVGSTLDTTAGVVSLTAALNARGKTTTGRFYAGEFRLTQKPARTAELTVLTLTGPKPTGCAAGGASAARKRPRKRSLWSSGSGGFTTVGGDASATELGTKWLTEDTCAGTLIRVTQGAVTVDDFPQHRTFVLRAPHSYLVHPGKGG